LLLERFDSARIADQINCPVLILQAQNDEIIPSQSTQRLRSAFKISPVYMEIESAGHNDIQQFAAFFSSLKQFVNVSGSDTN
jgi:uncharacterized protein